MRILKRGTVPLSKDVIDQALANIKRTPKPYMVAQPFQNFAPMKFTEPNVADPSQFDATLGAVGSGASTQHQMVTEQIANKQAKDLVASQQAEVDRLRAQLNGGGGGGATPNRPGATGGPRDVENNTRWGAIPEVSDLGKIRPHAPPKTINFHGNTFKVNSQVAPIFQAFLQNLWRKGYHPATIGGYGERPNPSLHPFGMAIDIDAARNPMQNADGHMQTTMPSYVSALAAKYGLSWGGDWRTKKDPMHFSVPWRGLQ
jgi:hypothetical protein